MSARSFLRDLLQAMLRHGVSTDFGITVRGEHVEQSGQYDFDSYGFEWMVAASGPRFSYSVLRFSDQNLIRFRLKDHKGSRSYWTLSVSRSRHIPGVMFSCGYSIGNGLVDQLIRSGLVADDEMVGGDPEDVGEFVRAEARRPRGIQTHAAVLVRTNRGYYRQDPTWWLEVDARRLDEPVSFNVRLRTFGPAFEVSISQRPGVDDVWWGLFKDGVDVRRLQRSLSAHVKSAFIDAFGFVAPLRQFEDGSGT